MDNQENKKVEKFVCRSCNSESKGTPGTCCGGKDREKTCGSCGSLHKEGNNTCSAGCGCA